MSNISEKTKHPPRARFGASPTARAAPRERTGKDGRPDGRDEQDPDARLVCPAGWVPMVVVVRDEGGRDREADDGR